MGPIHPNFGSVVPAAHHSHLSSCQRSGLMTRIEPIGFPIPFIDLRIGIGLTRETRIHPQEEENTFSALVT